MTFSLTYSQICTELLYQPLTLLDCLHTFCGSCLKEWFSAQGSRRRSSRSLLRFTCPSCRAGVRETRPNATVTTLLDMVLAGNPERVKATAEKEEIARKYKPGDSVFPAVVSEQHSPAESDDDDRRLLEEVRELSLRDSRSRAAQQSRRNGDARDRRDDGRTRDGERGARRQATQDLAQLAGQTPAGTEGTRRIEHQSSLRSLLSLPDAEVMEEEILRQIMEENLLDGIDLNNLGPMQEEELSERIADAYRRRHRLRSRSQQRRELREGGQGSRSHARTQSAQTPTTSLPRETSDNQPSSRPQFLDPFAPAPGSSSHRRRLSDQGSRRRRSPVRPNQASSSDDMLRPAARPSSDATSHRSRTSATGRRRPGDLNTSMARRATESARSTSNLSSRDQTSCRNNGRVSGDSPTSNTLPRLATHHPSLPRSEQNPQGLGSPTVSSLVPAPLNPSNRSRPSSSRSNVSQTSSPIYVEPSITCDRCEKSNIQYDLHKNCPNCNSGEFNICMRCYRLGRGCFRWSGFGPSAEAYFEKVLSSSNAPPMATGETPHVLISLKYRRLPESAQQTMNDGKLMTSDDPARRRRIGFFCDICQSPSNDCYWKCNQCNEGDWGFCNRCVNKGRCCTHALLPICRIFPANGSEAPTPQATSTPPPESDESFKILSFSTNCDICTYPIPASTTRFHCVECNHGDYDMCANCYLKLVTTGKISKENGHNGWRRCPKGHRMVVVGFEDHDEGQRRVIVRDLVGGRAVKDEHLQQQQQQRQEQQQANTNTSAIPSPEVGTGDWSWKEGSERRKKASRVRVLSNSNSPAPNTPESSPTSPVQNTSSATSPFPRFPPDGGVGLIVRALWSWYPEDDVKDELTFPRGAEITEAENINDDWFWGCYAGRTGLFPGAHVTVVGEVV